MLAVALGIAVLTGSVLQGRVAEAPGKVPWWTGTLDEALAEARSRGGLVMVDVWAEWCRFCKLLEEESMPDDLVLAELAKGVVPIRIEVDVHKGVGEEFGRAHRVSGLPLVLFLDGEGREVHRIESYVPAGLLAEEIAWARLASVPLAMLEAKVAADPRPGNLLALAQRHFRDGRAADADALWRRVVEADPEGREEAADDALFFLAQARIEAGDVDGALAHLERLTEKLVPGSRTRQAFYVRLELLESLPRTPEILPVYRLMAAKLDDDPQVLSDYAWYLAELGRDLDAAEAAARRAVAIDAESADTFDTLARVLFRQGRTAEAVESSARAIELDPGNVEYRERRLEYVQAQRRESAKPR